MSLLNLLLKQFARHRYITWIKRFEIRFEYKLIIFINSITKLQDSETICLMASHS